MTRTLDPITVTAGQTQSVDISRLGLSRPCELVLRNESPNAIELRIGPAPNEDWLEAWTANKFQLGGAQMFTLTAVQVQQGQPQANPSSVLLATVGDEGECIPGTYPTTLARAVIASLPWISVGTHTTTGAGAENLDTSTVPGGTQTLGVSIVGGSGVTAIEVVGLQSGTVYEFPSSSQPQGGWFTVPVNGTLDTTFRVSWTGSGGAGAVVAVYASGLAMGFPTLGQSAMGESISVAIASDQTALPWEAPSAVTRWSRVGIGTVVMVGAIAGKTVRIFGGVLEVTTAVAGAFIDLEDTAGNIAVHSPASAVGMFPFDLSGAPIGAVGVGAQLAITGGAANGAVSIAYSQA